MKMIVIIEGADATGKTTYARWVHVLLGGVILHYGNPNEWMEKRSAQLEYVDRLWRVSRDPISQNAMPAVLDRSFIGSAVWSRIGFHEPTLNSTEWDDLCLWYAVNGALVEIVVDRWDRIVDVLDERAESDTITDALRGQTEFLRLAERGDILYMDTGIYTADYLREDQRRGEV